MSEEPKTQIVEPAEESFLDAAGRWLMMAGALAALVVGTGYLSGVRYNSTPSLPEGLYTERALGAERPARGLLVMVCLPEELGSFGLERGYLNRGTCPGGASALGKAVIAVEGDTVHVTDDGVMVGAVPVLFSEPVYADSRGRETNPIIGTHVVEEGEVFVLSNYHGRSFDSRYFGVIPEASIRGVIRPLATWGHDWEGDLRVQFAAR